MKIISSLTQIVPASFIGIFLSGIFGITSAQETSKYFIETAGSIGLEGRLFLDNPAYTGQKKNNYIITFEPSIYLEGDTGASFTLKPFLKFDSADSNQNHFDIREAYYLNYGSIGNSEWEIRLGIDKVFWGTAESNNPVNIINQTDFVVHPDGKAKLGQPMIQGTLSGDWGTLALLVLPIHRPQTIPGLKGRFRPPQLVQTSRETITYLSPSGRSNTDLGARYSNTIGALDFGISIFSGTSRIPQLVPVFDVNSLQTMQPPILIGYTQYYGLTEQFGLDIQLIIDAFLGKAELVNRKEYNDIPSALPTLPALPFKSSYNASVIGGEYSIYGIFESDADLTLFAEWNHDTRGKQSSSALQNDLFYAARYTLNDFNDTDLNVALIDDRDYKTKTMRLEFNRQLSDTVSFNVEAFKFVAKDYDDTASASIFKDNYLAVNFEYNF